MSQPSAKTQLNPLADVASAMAAPRIAIERIAPAVDGGRFAAKAVVGQPVELGADIFIDGHDQLAARVLWQRVGEREWQAAPLRPVGNDRWSGRFVPQRTGLHRYVVEAWLDTWASYRSELAKKHRAGVATTLEIEEGRRLVTAAARRAPTSTVQRFAELLAQSDDAGARELLLSDACAAAMATADEQRFLVRSEPPLAIDVERLQAGFASWYELFPRSQVRAPDFGAPRHGTFDDVIARLPAIHAMGFDVLYFPPIHPIGHTHRKGRNNSLYASFSDPGSPYAIGSERGGHDAVHPQLGGIEAFRRLRVAAADYGIELALDFAVQCSPDHPWLKEHPEWFSWRPDGSIRYAENPPKKYEDIVNVDFYADGARPALWLALRDVIEYWIGEGVKMFRVDNPHTKPLPFWQWLIADIRSRHADAIFLSEAFTRPAMMYRLGKIGFTQSYTYFTWRHGKQELTDYLVELTQGPARDFFRPHFFVNTPDINPYFLQTSGRAGFLIRAALAGTLSGLWGLYSGFELCEGAALPGKEEYLDSEKYEIRPRDWHAPGNIVAEISRLNHIRRDNPALHTHLNLKFYSAWNDQVLWYGKHTPDKSNFVLALVSLDPHHGQSVHFEVPLWEFGLPDDGRVEVEELMGGGRFVWQGKTQHWWFDPHGGLPFAIFRIRPAL
ncbi:alpha-1,4-glucan--maltose-1-phosphate maltosyltransferase [Solimonas soli]|uniref:alpha-1,4-glucan--maltose-1-phosphate maltosyltransferase n=1 Tax=Solimonas soli TaxID=413479 RepID=UPI0004895E98|nr:alpha-1,4-glucan--maltose-1-phosphate maltosyltransferase [Solimonas soli]